MTNRVQTARKKVWRPMNPSPPPGDRDPALHKLYPPAAFCHHGQKAIQNWIVYLPDSEHLVSDTVSQGWPALAMSLLQGWSNVEYFAVASPEHEVELRPGRVSRRILPLPVEPVPTMPDLELLVTLKIPDVTALTAANSLRPLFQPMPAVRSDRPRRLAAPEDVRS